MGALARTRASLVGPAIPNIRFAEVASTAFPFEASMLGVRVGWW